MNKHLSMLFVAVAALYSAPAFAACPTGTDPCDDVTTVLTSPIQTQTAPGTGGPPSNIFIETSGGVTVKQASAAVTVNSPNFLVNQGKITNSGIAGARGIIVDAGNSSIDLTTFTQKGVENDGTIDLTGTGDNKIGILIQNGTVIGPIKLGSNSIIKVAGDGGRAIDLSSTAILNGDMNLDGTITITPTSATSVTPPNAPAELVNLAGTLNGNFTSAATMTASGAGAEGIIISGPICDALGCSSVTRSTATGASFGTFINFGSVVVTGTTATTTTTTKPEGGSVLVVTSDVEGGIVNAGPGFGSTVKSAVLSGSGYLGSSISAVVSIASPGTAVTIGEDTATPGDPDPTKNNFSFLNYGTIFAQPLNQNHSTEAINIQGAGTTALTTLTGGFYNGGTISAVAISGTGAGATNVSANAIVFNNWSVVPTVGISAASSAGLVNASVSGGMGGSATAIDFASFANNQDPSTHKTTIDILSGAKVTASATTLHPSTVLSLNAIAILDSSGTVTTINNGGTISATVTTLTSDSSSTSFSNVARAIDLSANTVGGITLNDAGTITGDVLLNGTQSGPNGTLVVVGAGSATGAGADPAQGLAASNAAAVPTPFGGAGPGGTGVTNNANNRASLTGALVFGTGQSTLYVNDFGSVDGPILSTGTLDVGVSQHGALIVTNTGDTGAMTVHNLNVYGGSLEITVTEGLREANKATIIGQGAGSSINIDSGSAFGVKIASFVPQPTTLGGFVEYKLIEGPAITIPDLATYQSQVENILPFYFQRDQLCISGADLTNCTLKFNLGATDKLVLDLRPKSAAQLGLTGDALTMFPAVNAVLTPSGSATASLDDQLGAAIINGITSNDTAEKVFSQFAPDVSGNERAIAVAITDQATGPVASRQRALRMYANQGGGFTLWGQEYAQYINDKGNTVGGGLTNFKDHGFGFAIGADGGDPMDGWYGAAFSYFAGDATETNPRNAKAETQWYMLTGYTDWRGHHLFLDTQAAVGLAEIKAKRMLTITSGNTTLLSREADSKRPGLLGAIGATTGAIFNWSNFFLMPEISLDAMTMREEGFTEKNGGAGFNLKVQPYYSTSLRTFVGVDSRVDWDLGDFVLQPEGRLGYRYELLNDPVKLHAAFASDPTNTGFTITGPDPTRGNVVAGATLGASTETWSMGANFDWVRGSNGSQTEVGTFTLVGRI